MKVLLQIIVLILVDFLLVLILQLSFSAIFMSVVLWLVYGTVIVRRLAYFYKKKWLYILSKIYMWGIAIFVGSFILIEGFLVYNIGNHQSVESLEEVDYMIVLGAGLRGEDVSPTLKARLDQAIAYYKLHPKTMIIVSGGQGPDEVISEAEAMRRYLEEMGIPGESIIKEDHSTTTLENIAFSKEILRKREEAVESILIVTHDYHLLRAQMLAYFMDLESIGLSAESSLLGRINYLIREYPTMIIDFFRVNVNY